MPTAHTYPVIAQQGRKHFKNRRAGQKGARFGTKLNALFHPLVRSAPCNLRPFFMYSKSPPCAWLEKNAPCAHGVLYF